MAGLDGLPDKRWSLRGTTEEGDEAWLIRAISRKLYRCPSCHGEIEIGSDHVVVQYVFETDVAGVAVVAGEEDMLYFRF